MTRQQITGFLAGDRGAGARPMVGGAEFTQHLDDDTAGPVFTALADPTRRHLVAHLAERGAATATELSAGLPITRQAVTKHLVLLGDAGLVSATREGREVRYRLSTPPLDDAMAWMAAVGARWDERLAALQRHVARNNAADSKR